MGEKWPQQWKISPFAPLTRSSAREKFRHNPELYPTCESDMPEPSPRTALPDVPYEDVAGFTRKLIHDVRNGLNALDLQLASMLDMASDTSSPLLEDVTLARRLLGDEARRLGQLSAQMRGGAADPIAYGANDLVEDLRERIERSFKDLTPPISWTVSVGSEPVPVDFEVLSGAVAELVRNAMQFRTSGGQIEGSAAIEGGEFIFELRHPQKELPGNPATWGEAPFRSTRRGAYGLGLFSARRALAALGGKLEIRHDVVSGELRSRITLPLTTP